MIAPRRRPALSLSLFLALARRRVGSVGSVVALALLVGCARSSSTTAAGAAATPSDVGATAATAATAGEGGAASGPSSPTVAAALVTSTTAADDLWHRAQDGDADDLARLADREGAVGLAERAERDRALRPTAARAAAFAEGLAAVAWLSRVATDGEDDEARAALESLADIGARPRRALDPEDGGELREGCDRLVALAKDGARPRVRRALALRFIRLMADRGCARGEGLPTDVDATVKTPKP